MDQNNNYAFETIKKKLAIVFTLFRIAILLTLIFGVIFFVAGLDKTFVYSKYYDIGQKHYKEGKYAEAINDYKQFLRGSPKNELAYFEMAQAQLKLGEYLEARKILKRAISINTSYRHPSQKFEITCMEQIAEIDKYLAARTK